MMNNYYYIKEISSSSSVEISRTDVWNEPLRFKKFDTTAEILAESLNYIEGQVVYNKELNSPCVRTSIGWSVFSTTPLL